MIDTSEFANLFTGFWSVVQSGNNFTLNYTPSAIPEPATYAAWAGGALLAFAAWRRRQRPRH